MLLDLWFHHCLPRPAGSWRGGYGFLPEKPRRRPDDDEVFFLICLQ